MPLPDGTRGDPAVQHLVKVIRIGMHEDRLPGATGRQRRDGGLGGHVLYRVHTDTEVGQQHLRQDLAQFIIDGRGARRDPVTTAIAAKRAEEGAV